MGIDSISNNYHSEDYLNELHNLEMNITSPLSTLKTEYLAHKDRFAQSDYQTIAEEDPNVFILLLEDARAAHDKDSDTKSIFLSTELDQVVSIVSALDWTTVVSLFAKARKELTRCYAFTIKLLINKLNDSEINIFKDKSWKEMREMIGSLTQVSPRIVQSPSFNIDYLGEIFATLDEYHLQKLVDSLDVNTVSTNLLPLFQIIKLPGANIKSKVVEPVWKFIIGLVPLLKLKYKVASPWPDQNILGLLLNQCKNAWLAVDYEWDSKYNFENKQKTISLNTKQRDRNNPCLVRMCFDEDKDARETYDHRLKTIHLEGEKSTYSAGGITYKKTEINGMTWVVICNNWAVISYIVADNPYKKTTTNPREILSDLWFQWTFQWYGIVMDRWHLGHEWAWLAELSSRTSLCIIWSCWGQTHQQKVVEIHPGIQYIWSLKTWHKAVNDAVFRSVMRDIAQGQDINRSTRSPDHSFILEIKEFNFHIWSYQFPNDNISNFFLSKLDELNQA